MQSVCMIAMREPYPSWGGEKFAMSQYINAFARLNFEITLIIISDEPRRTREYPKKIKEIQYFYMTKGRRLISSILSFLFGKSLQEGYFNVGKKIKQKKVYDYLFIHTIRLSYAFKYIKAKKKILYYADSISMNYYYAIRYVFFIYKLLYRLEFYRLKKSEKKVIKKIDYGIFHSYKDTVFLNFNESKKIIHIPIVKKRVDKFFNITSKTKKRFLLLSNFKSLPNHISVLDLISELSNGIQDLNFEIHLIGPNLSKSIQNKIKKYRYLKYLGPIDNIQDEILNSYGTICNVKIGAGMQNKILDGLSQGRTAFCNKFTYESYSYYISEKQNGIILFKDLYDMLIQMKQLINNIDKANQLGKEAWNISKAFIPNILPERLKKL